MSTVSKTKPNVTTSSLPQHVNQFSQRHSPLRSPVRSPHPLRHIVQYSPSRSKDAGEDLSRVDVDELFSRFTVSEVRSLKLKLQADADAQQQDLRLMVGERYRDLLEASSAIASISDASKRVKSLLEDVKSACDTTTETRRIQNINRTRSQSVYGVTSVARASGSSQDSQLASLQVLAAHLKLLLDTPEQIWRLLERKRYLHAAWLLLLARIVYRTLSTEEEDEEGELEWVKEGIDVMIQFPIIQRQWDVINSFRPQITYRATQSLREQPSNVLSIIGESTKPSPSSPTMIAETLLSIHLLDSLPLSDTLSLFLNQRSKTLQNLYARIQATPLFSSSALKPKNTQAISKSRRKNREVTATLLRSPSATPSLDLFKLPAIKDSDAAEKARKAERNRAVRDVRQSLRQVLELIGHTVSTSRRIFGAGSSKPLLEALLGSAPSGLPSWDEFQISTSQILSSLPSSTLLQRYLPASVQSYAPYIDITSRSAHLSSDNVNSTTSTWLKTSLQSLQDHLSGWLGMLHNVKEVWSVWIGLHNWQDNKYVAATWLDAFDTVELEETMDLIKKACVHRVQEVLKDKLIEIEGAVVKEVQKCVELLREGSDESTWDANPSAFQFSPSYSSQKFDEKGLVALLGASTSIAESKQALRQRVENRTPLLHSTLTRLEQLAGELKDDLSSLEGPSGQTLADATDLSQKYRPEAETTALSVVACMKEILERENVSSASEDTNYRISLFVGRVALELATSSSFIDDLVTGSLHAFQVGMQEVHSLSLDYWKQHAVGKALASYRAFLAIQKPTLAAPFPSAPSPQLMRSLLQLVSAIHQLGMRADQTFSIRPDRSLMNAFVAGLAAEVLNHCSEELLFDLMLLRSLPGLDDEDGMKLANTVELLQERLSSQSPASYREQVVLHITHIIPTQLARIQLLFSPAFSGQDVSSLDAPRSRDRAPVQPNAPKPPAEHDMKLALNLAKPSARFGLLLVPGSGGTMR